MLLSSFSFRGFRRQSVFKFWRGALFFPPILVGFLSGCSGSSLAPVVSKTRSTVWAEGLTEAGIREHTATGDHWIVSTQGKSATAAAAQILKAGGSLIDAAIAASFAISVERPQSTGLGGGGFLIYRQAKSGKIYAFDFRERAPLHASKTMFLDPSGNVIDKKSSEGIFSVGVPGLVAGLWEVHHRFGKHSWQEVIAPSIALAQDGFAVYPSLAAALADKKDVLSSYPGSKKIFIKPSGEPYLLGEQLVQKDLARTLRRISQHGKAAVYGAGPIRTAILKESAKYSGLLSRADFEKYRVIPRTPVRGKFLGYEVVSMPPPSSGGVHVLQILGMLSRTPFQEWGYLNPRTIHATASAMQSAFADRSEYLGDPDFVPVPVKGLLDEGYLKRRQSEWTESRARKKAEVMPGLGPFVPVKRTKPKKEEHTETTHFSMMDSEGNVVVSTQTINDWFGSGIVASGTGIVLNDEMDDFAAKVGVPNIFGALGADANAVEPQKTPLSSMSPTLVLDSAGNPVLALGAPGGTKILTCVAQTIVNTLGFGMSLPDAVSSIRMHHQWSPDRLDIDAPGPGADTETALRQMGYELKVAPGAVSCRVMAVARIHKKGGDSSLRSENPQAIVMSDAPRFIGVSDPRDAGSAAGY